MGQGVFEASWRMKYIWVISISPALGLRDHRSASASLDGYAAEDIPQGHSIVFSPTSV